MNANFKVLIKGLVLSLIAGNAYCAPNNLKQGLFDSQKIENIQKKQAEKPVIKVTRKRVMEWAKSTGPDAADFLKFNGYIYKISMDGKIFYKSSAPEPLINMPFGYLTLSERNQGQNIIDQETLNTFKAFVQSARMRTIERVSKLFSEKYSKQDIDAAIRNDFAIIKNIKVETNDDPKLKALARKIKTLSDDLFHNRMVQTFEYSYQVIQSNAQRSAAAIEKTPSRAMFGTEQQVQQPAREMLGKVQEKQQPRAMFGTKTQKNIPTKNVANPLDELPFK